MQLTILYLLLSGLLRTTPSRQHPRIVTREKSMKVAHDPGLALVPGLILILPAINIATVVMKLDVSSTRAGHAHRILPDIVAGKHQGGQIKGVSVLLMSRSHSPWCDTQGHNQVARRGDRPGKEMSVVVYRGDNHLLGGAMSGGTRRGEVRSHRH